ncbi:hypothetical protein [Bradyrhizobium zhanjiangense]|uniref:hypothetical protein n=1 Tax=Bradyrhizobium zhanjiangense TaxID=1325107 RepID=UPI001FE1E46B|nr:hypothetical protein [Bradyrhizobium zhanjiangense]
MLAEIERSVVAPSVAAISHVRIFSRHGFGFGVVQVGDGTGYARFLIRNGVIS